MLVFRQHRIYRIDMQANPHVLYIFGDNLERKGNGGQAKEMRGEPNSFGIATKRKPSHNYREDYFHDGETNLIEFIDFEFGHLRAMAKGCDYKAICIPLDGIGTGLSKLPEKAPKLLEYINKQLKELETL